jgi:TolA-binding protein
MRSSAERGWPATLQNAQMDAASGRFAAADSTLVQFARQHSGSSEAMEAHYWLALYALDPDNKGASLDQATDELSTYLAASGHRKHVAEAASLSRVAVALRSLTQEANAAASRARASGAAAAAANARAADAASGDTAEHADTTTSSDAEVKRLREQLAKANAELERIRKRLTTGGKPPR